MKKKLLSFITFTFCAAVYAQTPRLCLYEEFTGETCPPCATYNPGLNALLAQPANFAKCVAIKWQVPIPSAPSKPWSLYQTNKAEIDWRYRSTANGGYGYGINSAPSGKMDGQDVTVFGASSNNPVNLNSTVISTAQSYTSAFSITMTPVWQPGCNAITLSVNIQATAPFTAVGNLVFRCVMVERKINFAVQPGTNGEKDFEDVAIKSFPTIQNGTSMAGTWTNGQTQSFVLNCPLPSYTRKKSEVAFVGFIQDDGNRRVAQAARTSPLALPAEQIAAIGASVNVACSSNISPIATVKNDGTVTINNLTITPYIDGSIKTPFPWAGTLAAGATLDIPLTGVTSPVTQGVHTFSFNVAMSSPQYNISATNNFVNYMYINTYTTTSVTEGFAPTAFPPARWVLVNKDAQTTWSRFFGSGAYGLSNESTKCDFYANTNVGDIDELILPPADMSASLGSPELTFDVAYSDRNGSNDKLEVFVSDNCGATWMKVYGKSGSNLATVSAAANSAYVPDQADPSQWRTETVALAGFNKANMIVKFVATNDNGNNLYLDNVNLAQSAGDVGLSSLSKSGLSVNVYPNPASSQANVSITANAPQSAKITMVNIVGQVVFEKEVTLNAGSNNLAIATDNLVNGVYTVNVNTGNKTQAIKVTIMK